MANIPSQRLSYKEKVKNDYQFVKETIDNIIDNANDSTRAGKSSNTDYYRKLTNYKLYNNILDQNDFKQELNPLGFDLGQAEDKIDSYNEAYTIINRLLGEEWKKDFNYKAILVNSEGIKEKELYKTQMYKQWLTYNFQKELQTFTSMLIEQNPELEKNPEALQQELDQIMDPEEVDKYVSTEYLTAQEIKANKLLKAYTYKLNLRLKKNHGFKHGLLAGEEFVWVGIKKGKPHIEVLNPLGVFYHKSQDTLFVQDSLYAGYRTRRNIGDILDRYRNDLTEDQINRLLELRPGMYGVSSTPGKKMEYDFQNIELKYLGRNSVLNEDEYEGNYGYSDEDDIEEYHVEWRSERKVGKLTYTDPLTNETIVDIVDESYKPNKFLGESIEWEWIPEIWEGTRINTDIYINMRPKDIQFAPYSDPYEVKLGYHGVVYSNTNAPAVSMMDRIKPYFYLLLVVINKLKKLIAQDSGKKIPIDVSRIDRKTGIDKTLYYFKNQDFYIYNSLENSDNPLAANRGAISGATYDMSNAQFISNYINIIGALEQKIASISGLSEARLGRIKTTQAVGNTNQEIIQSSQVTEPLFVIHETLWEQVLNSLLNVIQYSYEEEGEFMQYILDDSSRGLIELEPGEISYQDMGVFIKFSSKEHEIYNQLSQLALPILQNQGRLSDILKIFKKVSLEDLERELVSYEKKKEKLQQLQQQQDREALVQVEQLKKELEEQKMLLDKYKTDTTNQTKILIAKLQSDTSIVTSDIAGDSTVDLATQEASNMLDSIKTANDTQLKEKELQIKKQISDNQEKTKKYVADTNLKIAKENKTNKEIDSKK